MLLERFNGRGTFTLSIGGLCHGIGSQAEEKQRKEKTSIPSSLLSVCPQVRTHSLTQQAP